LQSVAEPCGWVPFFGQGLLRDLLQAVEP
jgi:hypothetical protein